MKTNKISQIILMLIISFLLFSFCLNNAKAQIQFEKGSWEEIKNMAKIKDELIFMDAYTSWCIACNRMSKNVFTDDTVAAYYNNTFINAKFEMETGEGKEIAKLYDVKVYPTFLFINYDGEIVHRVVGSRGSEDFVKLGKEAQLPGKQLADFEKTVITYEGKLLMGAKGNEPLKNQKVILMDSKNMEGQSSVTDKYGDFSFKNIDKDKTYSIKVPGNGMKIKDGQVFIAKQDGTIINSLKKSGNYFVYELLPVELITLSRLKEDDPELKIMKFAVSKNDELMVSENIYYAPNSFEINNDAIEKLNKIVSALQKNKTIKLSIGSYTDSKGDDASNELLSEKRAQNVLEFFLTKGISKERLSAKGFGEKSIKNRCKNGVDCSEKEHELNRRTEFKFSK